VNEYTASNGVKVEWDGDTLKVDTLSYFDRWGTHYPALREFFRAEEDDRLHRWRWPAKPNYFVIVDEDGDVEVFDEERPNAPRLYARNSVSFVGNFGGAARAYFDAHPEPKPAWFEAREGEVWVLGLKHEAWELPYIVVDDTDGETVAGPRFFPVPPLSPNEPGWRPGFFPSDFANGHRLYPEETS
jgi:hypothetical protein